MAGRVLIVVAAVAIVVGACGSPAGPSKMLDIAGS